MILIPTAIITTLGGALKPKTEAFLECYTNNCPEDGIGITILLRGPSESSDATIEARFAFNPLFWRSFQKPISIMPFEIARRITGPGPKDMIFAETIVDAALGRILLDVRKTTPCCTLAFEGMLETPVSFDALGTPQNAHVLALHR